MEHQNVDQEERERPGVGRNQNVLLVLPHDAAAVPSFLEPALERVDPDEPATQLLVLTPSAETAIAVAESATRRQRGAPVRVIPATSARRAARLLRERPAAVVVGPPVEILELIRGAALKLTGVRALVIAWADTIGDGGMLDDLEAVMAEVPKDAARTIVTSHMTPTVETIVERYARRARRAVDTEEAPDDGVDVSYVVVAPQTRRTAVRRLLDDLDPERAAVYARADETAATLPAIVRALGYLEEDGGLVITRGEAVPGATLVILYELPPSRDVLRALSASGARLMALITPSQLSALRSLAGTGRMTPYTLSGPTARARARQEQLREELRAVLAEGVPAHEILALEPLFGEYDGAELAGAALRLLVRERERSRELAAAAAARGEASRAAAPGTVRIFVNAGTRDEVGPRDLVGAIANEVGLAGSQIGKVEVRENHALVEIPAEAAEQVVARLTGVMLRGRRLVARIDQERPGRERGERRDRDRGERPRARGGERPPRPPRPSRG